MYFFKICISLLTTSSSPLFPAILTFFPHSLLPPCRLRAVVPARGGPHLHLSAKRVQEPHRAGGLGRSRSEPVCRTLDRKTSYPLSSSSYFSNTPCAEETHSVLRCIHIIRDSVFTHSGWAKTSQFHLDFMVSSPAILCRYIQLSSDWLSMGRSVMSK